MRQTHWVPHADPTKSDVQTSNELVPNGDSHSVAPAFSRSFTTKANTNWRGVPLGITGSFRRGGMLAVLLFLCSIPITAQDSPLLTPGRISITLLVGYRTRMGLPIQPETTGSTSTLSLDSGPAYGLAVGFRMRNDDIIEFRWTRQNSYGRAQQANVALPTTPTTADQFHCDFSHEYLMPYHEDRVRPYLVGSVGATNFSSGSSQSSAHFSVGVGGGVKFFVSKHFGFRTQAEWLPMFVSPRQLGPCTGACAVNVGGTVASQVEATFGPIIKF